MERKHFLFILLLALGILHARGGCNVISAFDIRAQRGQPIEAVCRVANGNEAGVSELGIRYVIYDMSGLNVIADGVRTVGCSIGPGASQELTMELRPVDMLLSGTYTLEIMSVDGEPNGGSYGPYEAGIEVVGKLFDRVVVCEEFTGNTCGWCPRGIEGLARMREKYPDTFIGIGVHVYSTSDPLYCDSYSGLSSIFSTAPSCIFDRKPSRMGDPYQDIENLYLSERSLRSFGSITMDGVWADDGQSVTLTTHSEFSRDERNCAYRVAFVIIENGVDRDASGNEIPQANNYSGSSVPMNGWEDKPRYVATVYDDVARAIYGLNGLDDSELKEVEAGCLYDYTYTLPLPDFLCRDNLEFVALLYDGIRNEIVNACRLDSHMQIPNSIVSQHATRPHVRQSGNEIMLSPSSSGHVSMTLYSSGGEKVAETACQATAMAEVPLSVGNRRGPHLLRVVENGFATTYKINIRSR